MSGAASEPAKDFRKNKGFITIFLIIMNEYYINLARAKVEALDNILV